VRNVLDETGERRGSRELEKRRKWGETRELKKIRKKEENEERREIERFLKREKKIRTAIFVAYFRR
jgi:hypothetical protein